MAKRRLSKQQQHRIQKIQAERARRASKREQNINAQREAGELGPEQSGLVIAHYGQQLDVEVKGHQVPAPRGLHAEILPGSKPQIRLAADNLHPRQTSGCREGVVPRGIVDHDDFEVSPALLFQRGQAAGEQRASVEVDDHNRYGGRHSLVVNPQDPATDAVQGLLSNHA